MKELAITWIIFLLLFSGVGFIGYQTVQDLKEDNTLLATSAQKGFDTITQSMQIINKNVDTLEKRIDGAEQGLKSVGVKVQQVQEISEQGISTLSGQLKIQQEESEKKFSQLEDKIIRNVKSVDLSTMIDKAIKSVVSVNTDIGLGSGVFVKSGGILITNEHVVRGAQEGSVRTIDGQTHRVSILGTDTAKDIAVLQIDGDYPALEFASSVRVGEKVVGMGNPGGLSFTVTEGIISAVDRVQNENRYVQTDVPINPGNSGGPLVNSLGQIVGINTMKIKGFEGVGFALEAKEVQNSLNNILAAVEARNQ